MTEGLPAFSHCVPLPEQRHRAGEGPPVPCGCGRSECVEGSPRGSEPEGSGCVRRAGRPHASLRGFPSFLHPALPGDAEGMAASAGCRRAANHLNPSGVTQLSAVPGVTPQVLVSVTSSTPFQVWTALFLGPLEALRTGQRLLYQVGPPSLGLAARCGRPHRVFPPSGGARGPGHEGWVFLAQESVVARKR